MQQKKETYEKEVARTLFREFQNQKKENKYDELRNVHGFTRPEKYLYYINQLPLPILAYVWGMLPYDEAQELVYMKELVQHQNIVHILDKLKFAEMNEQETALYAALKEQVDDGVFDADIIDQLELLPVPQEDLALFEMTYEDFFRQLLTDPAYDNDMYYDIMKHLNGAYLSFLTLFQTSVAQFVDYKFDVFQEEVLWEIESKKQINQVDMSDAFDQFDFINGILSYTAYKGVKSPNSCKCRHLWERLYQGVFKGIVQLSDNLPPHKSFPDIKKNITTMAQAFQTYFPQAPDKNLADLRDSLFECARVVLAETASDAQQKKEFLQWFDKKTNYHYYHDISQKSNTYESDVNSDVVPLSVLTSSVKTEKTKNKKQRISEQELQETKKVLETLKEKYLTDEDFYSDRSGHLMFALAKDYEMLYLMGVLNAQEYRLCEIYEQKQSEKNMPCSVTDIVKHQLDTTDEAVLPIKKEYLTAMREIQLASRMHRELTLSSFDHLGGMIYCETDDLLEKEGFFLNDFVAFSQYCRDEKYPKRLQYARQLVDSYWKEVTSQLTDLPKYTGRPEVKARLNRQVVLFNPEKETSDWRHRVKIYHSFINQFKKDIYTQFRENEAVRSQMSHLLNDIVTPFETFVKDRHLKIKSAQHKGQNYPLRKERVKSKEE